MSDEDRLYFIDRAEAEIEMAQRSEHPKVVAAHYQLAQSYLARVYPEESEKAGDRQPN